VNPPSWSGAVQQVPVILVVYGIVLTTLIHICMLCILHIYVNIYIYVCVYVYINKIYIYIMNVICISVVVSFRHVLVFAPQLQSCCDEDMKLNYIYIYRL
jgi:hypothetical protein